AVDGRFRTCYPQTLIDMHFDFYAGDWPDKLRHRDEQSGPMDTVRVLDHENPNLVLIETRNRFARGVIEQHGGWVMLYQDGLAQLWGRTSIYDDSSSFTYVPATTREITNRPQSGSVDWPALPSPRVEQPQLLSAVETE
ncbi:MAG: hypothetical protein MI757_19115, partial [Pirellulales bacterium]|nr:hypothetical protein [Pirellulales bacterium]